ncbi:MAG: polysaccharide deacetylase family protein [Bacteroidota bacterium]
MVLIYTHKITPRLTYTFDFILNEILGLEYRITENKEEFQQKEGPKINYSDEDINDSIFIKPNNLLFENEIKPQNIFVTQWDNVKIFFQTNDDSVLPFDLFAASFYLVSRYEEYLPFSADNHGRFEAKESLAFKNNFLQEPIIDQWAYIFADILQEKYPGLHIPKRKFRYISTIDVDNAYAFLFKGISRTLGATFRSLVNLDLQDNFRRYRTLTNKRDPYDTYDIFFDTHQKYGIKPIWFFLVGDSSRYDNNVSPAKQGYQNLIRSIARKSQVGIHTSYETFTNENKLKDEIQKLEKIIDRNVYKSRQHYLRLHFNKTYQNLIASGITEDYTMGYATNIGFRASTCTPFKFYDLQNEEETDLKVYPFEIMDITLNKYKNYNVTEAISSIESVIEKIKKVDGTFISIWHNEALSDHGHWKGWENVYREMLRFVFES